MSDLDPRSPDPTREQGPPMPMTEEQLARMRALLAATWALAEPELLARAGREFLDDLLADRDGEIVLNVAWKGRTARLCVNWPKISPRLETVVQLTTMPGDGMRAN